MPVARSSKYTQEPAFTPLDHCQTNGRLLIVRHHLLWIWQSQCLLSLASIVSVAVGTMEEIGKVGKRPTKDLKSCDLIK